MAQLDGNEIDAPVTVCCIPFLQIVLSGGGYVGGLLGCDELLGRSKRAGTPRSHLYEDESAVVLTDEIDLVV